MSLNSSFTKVSESNVFSNLWKEKKLKLNNHTLHQANINFLKFQITVTVHIDLINYSTPKGLITASRYHRFLLIIHDRTPSYGLFIKFLSGILWQSAWVGQLGNWFYTQWWTSIPFKNFPQQNSSMYTKEQGRIHLFLIFIKITILSLFYHWCS